jgi:diacylglycerol kinase (ATP)
MGENSTPPAFDKSGNTGMTRIINAARFSAQGLKSAFRRESAFRQEIIVFVILLPVGFMIARSLSDFVILVCVSAMVLVVELLNSAVEAAVDRMGPEHHELSGLAKDYGSAAVLIALVIAGAVWLLFLFLRLA